MKAALLAGAIRLPAKAANGVLFDNHQGFGRVNLDAILTPSGAVKATFINEKKGLHTGEVYTTSVKALTVAGSIFYYRP